MKIDEVVATLYVRRCLYWASLFLNNKRKLPNGFLFRKLFYLLFKEEENERKNFIENSEEELIKQA